MIQDQDHYHYADENYCHYCCKENVQSAACEECEKKIKPVKDYKKGEKVKVYQEDDPDLIGVIGKRENGNIKLDHVDLPTMTDCTFVITKETLAMKI